MSSGGSQPPRKPRRPRKTGLDRIRERRGARVERERRAAAREAQTAARLARAVEKIAEKRLLEELGPIFREHGHGKVEETEEQIRERERVEAMLKRDRKDRITEQDRQLAEHEVMEGVFVNLSDTVVEPTPEWLEKGEVATFRPRLPDGTVRDVKSVRRVATPMIVRLHNKGAISDEQFAACAWYRRIHEDAGLEGRYSFSRTGATSGFAGIRGDSGVAGHIPMTIHEAEARGLWRSVRDQMTSFYLRFFDAVVIDDVPITRAVQFARCRREKGYARFRQVIEEVRYFCEANDVDLLGMGRDWAGLK